MNILDIACQTYRVPFGHRFSTAHGTLAVREGAILTLTTTQNVIGVGEIAPFPGMSKETLAEALRALTTLILRLSNLTLEDALTVLERERETLPPSTVCGIEMALLDALERTFVENRFIDDNRFIDSPSRKTTQSIAVNAVIGARTTSDAVNAAIHAKDNGFSCIKLKVGVCTHVRQEIARIAAVREALGIDVALRLDANEGWTLEQAKAILLECIPYNIQYVEQPLSAHDIEGMRQLRKMVPIMLAADEAVHDVQHVYLLMEREAANVLILKPQLVGGLRACRQIVEEAARHGIACVLTTTIESGVSVAATLKLASSLPEITLACGLGTLPLLVDDLICEHLSIKNGVMNAPDGPGWGVTLDEAAMHKYSYGATRV